MTGVDISPEFLAAAGRDAEGSSVPIRWRQSEMRDLPWTAEFDAAFCFGNSFGFLDDSGDADFLAAVSRALVPGGRFAIDYGQSAESVFPRIEPRVEGEIGGIGFVEETRYEPLTGRVENRYEFSRGGKREIKLASQRVYTVRELVRMLERAGFRIASVFGSTSEEAFGLGSPRLIILGEK
jgi:SAM-dependent methyltransferase